MTSLNIKKSNKTVQFQVTSRTKIITSLKTTEIKNLSEEQPFGLINETKLHSSLVKRFQMNKINYSSLSYILSKNKEIRNIEKQNIEAMQLLTEWSKESGVYKSNNFHFKM